MGDARAAVTPADPQGRKDEKLPWGSEGPRGWRDRLQPAIRERHRLVGAGRAVTKDRFGTILSRCLTLTAGESVLQQCV
jgi:hypothetical protein